jgi:hypothetical protein
MSANCDNLCQDQLFGAKVKIGITVFNWRTKSEVHGNTKRIRDEWL